MDEPRSVSILGATGSIGATTLALLRRDPARYPVKALTAHDNLDALVALAREFKPEFVALGNPALHVPLHEALAGSGVRSGAGPDALLEAAAIDADWTMAAIIGIAGLMPAITAIRRGGIVALANKESLVAAGELVMAEVAKSGARLLPVDSEHNAVFQITTREASRATLVTLTASGGPFREWSIERLRAATPAQAVRHPNWSMGAKISVDSATLMNKGLELIEAMHLFALAPDELDVLIHPQSTIHCLVHYDDGSVFAHLSAPDMTTPIAHALGWPDRLAVGPKPLDLAALGTLEFSPPDVERFPCLRLAEDAMRAGGAMPLVLNTANEIAVEHFLAGRLGFTEIPELIERTLEREGHSTPHTLEEVLEMDHIIRSHMAEEPYPA